MNPTTTHPVTLTWDRLPAAELPHRRSAFRSFPPAERLIARAERQTRSSSSGHTPYPPDAGSRNFPGTGCSHCSTARSPPRTIRILRAAIGRTDEQLSEHFPTQHPHTTYLRRRRAGYESRHQTRHQDQISLHLAGLDTSPKRSLDYQFYK